jgi:hypothetical protein
MADDEDVLWEAQMRATTTFAKHRDWALSTGFPDPTYNRNNGWTLDQFAMHFEPKLVTAYKKILADSHRHPDTPEKYDGLRWLEVDEELSSKIKIRLLDPRFRVTAFRPGDYEPTVVPRALLENAHVHIIVSELSERRGATGPRRHFEHVRVFDQRAEAKSSGRKATYDWLTLAGELERVRPEFSNKAELVEWCRANVKPMPGERPAKDGPNDKTIRAAIAKYELMKFVSQSSDAIPGN